MRLSLNCHNDAGDKIISQSRAEFHRDADENAAKNQLGMACAWSRTRIVGLLLATRFSKRVSHMPDGNAGVIY